MKVIKYVAINSNYSPVFPMPDLYAFNFFLNVSSCIVWPWHSLTDPRDSLPLYLTQAQVSLSQREKAGWVSSELESERWPIESKDFPGPVHCLHQRLHRPFSHNSEPRRFQEKMTFK